MKNIILISLLLISCSSNNKQKPEAQKCMDMLKNTKIKAPRDIKYIGVFTNANEKEILNNNAYAIRIVKHGKNCKALIIDYHTTRKPVLWTSSEKFNCNLNQLSFETNYAVYSPLKKGELPHQRVLKFKGHLQKDGDLKGAFEFLPSDEYEKSQLMVNQLKNQKDVDESMASFDWEIIQLMEYKNLCAQL